MRIALLQAVVLTLVAAAAVALGSGFTQSHYGGDGIRAMWAAAVICWLASIVAALVVMAAVWRWPQHVGQAAFAGTGIRLLLAMALAVGWQVTRAVHLRAFLGWLIVLYLAMLVVDTTFGVWLVRRQYLPTKTGGS